MKHKLMLAMAAIAMIAATAPAAYFGNQAGLGDHRWDNAANWFGGVVYPPDLTENVAMYYGSPQPTGWGYALIDSATTAQAATIWLNPSFGAGVTDPADLRMTGGTLQATRIYIGDIAGLTGPALFTMSGGTATFTSTGTGSAAAQHIGSVAGSKGKVVISGGTFQSNTTRINFGYNGYGELVLSGTGYIRANHNFVFGEAVGSEGRVYMSGGVLESTTQSVTIGQAGTGYGEFTGGTMKITNTLNIGSLGLMKVSTNGQFTIDYTGTAWTTFRDKVLGFVTSGKILGMSGQALTVAQNVQVNEQATTMTFIPEPATLAILGLGSLALLRRRK